MIIVYKVCCAPLNVNWLSSEILFEIQAIIASNGVWHKDLAFAGEKHGNSVSIFSGVERLSFAVLEIDYDILAGDLVRLNTRCSFFPFIFIRNLSPIQPLKAVVYFLLFWIFFVNYNSIKLPGKCPDERNIFKIRQTTKKNLRETKENKRRMHYWF